MSYEAAATARDLTGIVAVVTGAGSGVGRATAIAVAAAGAVPALLGRGHDALAATASEISHHGGHSLVVPVDVTDQTAVDAAFAEISASLGGIDVVILAAGIGHFGPLETYQLADWEATLATNLTGPFLCARAAVPHLRRRGGGAIIAIGSGAGKQGYANLGAYSASKFGLLGLMQSLAQEVSADGIKVCTIIPGSILTPFGGRSTEEKRAAMARDPGKRYLEPEDVAEAVLFLLRQPGRAWIQEMNLWPF